MWRIPDLSVEWSETADTLIQIQMLGPKKEIKLIIGYLKKFNRHTYMKFKTGNRLTIYKKEILTYLSMYCMP